MSRLNSTAKGVADAWDFWLSQHDVTVPDCIIEAVKAAFTAWLDRNRDEVVAAIAGRVASDHAHDLGGEG